VAGSGAHRILRPAQTELRAAARRYEEERIGLGERFVLAIDKAINDAVTDPLRWPLMPSVPTELGMRRRLVDGFPYAVVYRIVTSELVEIVAVMHGKRSPDYWKERR
jgi:plasmid stabilization system protein ParE